jgi:hypothetical protein
MTDGRIVWLCSLAIAVLMILAITMRLIDRYGRQHTLIPQTIGEKSAPP